VKLKRKESTTKQQAPTGRHPLKKVRLTHKNCKEKLNKIKKARKMLEIHTIE